MDNIDISFHQKLSLKFSNKVLLFKFGKNFKKIPTTNSVKLSNISSPPVPPRPSKEELSELKYHGENQKNLKTNLTKRRSIFIFKHCLRILRKLSN